MAKTKRRSLSERDAAAIAGDFSFPATTSDAHNPEATPTSNIEAAPAAAPGPAAAAAPGAAVTTATRKLGVYLPVATFEAAKSAYLADFDDTDGPDTFAGWVDAVLARFADLSSDDRVAASDNLSGDDTGPATQRTWSVATETLNAVAAALSADRRAGRVTSRSQFVVDALRSAIAIATRRRDGQLPPAPPRLPNRLTR